VNVFNTFGEGVPQSLRHLVHEAFGSKLVDRYSCGEIGLIALQCPKHDHYHVMSGTVLLEIVDEAGLPCPIGQPGHVLVTGLQSYAMPIIRYELGDIAQWGPPCDCGIGLPVIEKILGKTRDFVLHPNGHKHFVSLGGAFAHDVTALQIYEVVFYTNSIIEFTYTARAELSLMELESLEAQLQERFGHPWPVVFKRVVAIAHGGFRKRREFSKMDVPYMPAPDSMSTGRTHAS
jgi:phenylacetate-CoA ligase